MWGTSRPRAGCASSSRATTCHCPRSSSKPASRSASTRPSRCRSRRSGAWWTDRESPSSTGPPPPPRGTTTSRRNLDAVSDLDLREEPFDGPSAQLLTAQVQQEYVVRYGGPDTTPVDTTEFARPSGRFLVGYL